MIANVNAIVENLDGMDAEDLRSYGKRLQGLTVPQADNLTRELLISYAFRKADAMDARAAGNITEALRVEFTCDSTYSMLPKNARW